MTTRQTTQTDTALSALALVFVGGGGGLLVGASALEPLGTAAGGLLTLAGVAALVAAGVCIAIDERRALPDHGGRR